MSRFYWFTYFVFHINYQLVSLATYLWIQPLAHIRNWVATLYGLIVSLHGLWRFFTTS
jgi:hypothetical protein